MSISTILIDISNSIQVNTKDLSLIFTFFTIFSRTKFNIFTGIGLAGIGYSAIFPLFISSGSTLYKKGRGGSSNYTFCCCVYREIYSSVYDKIYIKI